MAPTGFSWPRHVPCLDAILLIVPIIWPDSEQYEQWMGLRIKKTTGNYEKFWCLMFFYCHAWQHKDPLEAAAEWKNFQGFQGFQGRHSARGFVQRLGLQQNTIGKFDHELWNTMELWQHWTSSRDVQYDKKYYSESNYWTTCIHCMIQNITVHVSNRMLWTPDASNDYPAPHQDA